MARQIWVGPVLGSNRARIVERCASLISEGRAESVLYLTASYPLLELVTTGLLDGERNRGVWGSLPVHLFRGFVRHVLATASEEETSLPLLPLISIDRDDLPLKRSLLAQIIRGLARAGRLSALAPLVHSEGCINSIASLVGEMQRAAKTPVEVEAIVLALARDLNEPLTDGPGLPRQIDFDREMSLIYSVYWNALDRFHLTEDDADQLRALSVLRGEVEGKAIRLPWLEHVRLLVLDGFFDFTPIQGEILRLLIPQIPEVIVNLNRDERNPEIFRPYERTIRQLGSMADFEVCASVEEQPVAGLLARLRTRLFNPFAAQPSAAALPEQAPGAVSVSEPEEPNIRLFECGDRETEIRMIAKEIKQLVLLEGYGLSEIALVVRQRAAYSDAIARIFEDEAIPCAIERRSTLVEVPAVRAAQKLFHLLRRVGETGSAKIGDLADLLKSGYFRPSEAGVAALHSKFEREHEPLLKRAHKDGVRAPAAWDIDELENAIAFVGGELRIADWLSRARRLVGRTAKPTDIELADDEETEADGFVSVDVESENVSEIPPDIEQPGSEVKPRLAREVHPAVIAWAATLIHYVNGLIGQTAMEGRPADLRLSLLLLLERLEFAGGIRSRSLASEEELPRATLDLRGLEGMRQALTAAVRSIEIAEVIMAESSNPAERVEALPVKLAALLDEVTRCLRGQGEAIGMGGGDRDGLQVLEATDVRGLQFRAIFIAGLIEGGFPRRTPRDWIYPHEERERLSEYGLTLEDISPATLLKEEHYFYQAACRATERLYLSRPLMQEGDTETVASYYIEEVNQAVAPLTITSEIVRRDFDGRELFRASTGSEVAIALVRQSERHRHPSQGANLLPPPYIEQAISWAREKGYLSWQASERINIERKRGGKRFTEFDGKITNRELIKMLEEQFGERHVFSASELSLYGKCPFKFYAERILRLDPRGEAALDLKAMDAGRLLHEVLRRFFERHRTERLSSREREALRAELQHVADEVFDEHEHAVPPLNPQVWRIDREIRKVLLDQVLIYELSLQENADGAKAMRPTFFELGFGMKDDDGDPHSTNRRLELSGPEGQTVLLRGRIDRVDIAPDGTVIAYDYKLSKGAGVPDMREGRDLQIGIYLTALEQLFLRGHPIAGGGFYVLRGKQDRRNRGLYRATFNDYAKLGSGNIAAKLTDDKWHEVRREMDARIWEFIDGMKAGRFLVEPSAPKESCPRCDFSSVCRYETFRIRGKK
jgi:ATP-dependent helicase/DNAse subunit B